jgi:crotonobetainyl-CoA:carnitine CoA-transferase CaiB-like acyl-CoA transferase
VIAANGPFMFPRLVEMMGNPEALLDPRFTTAEGLRNPELRDVFEASVLSWSMDYTKHEIVAMAEESGLICAAVHDMSEVAEDRHYNERGVFVDIDHPVMGTVRSIGRPFVMNETPWQMRRPPPTLGQHNSEVYGEIGYDEDRLAHLRERGVI